MLCGTSVWDPSSPTTWARHGITLVLFAAVAATRGTSTCSTVVSTMPVGRIRRVTTVALGALLTVLAWLLEADVDTAIASIDAAIALHPGAGHQTTTYCDIVLLLLHTAVCFVGVWCFAATAAASAIFHVSDAIAALRAGPPSRGTRTRRFVRRAASQILGGAERRVIATVIATDGGRTHAARPANIRVVAANPDGNGTATTDTHSGAGSDTSPLGAARRAKRQKKMAQVWRSNARKMPRRARPAETRGREPAPARAPCCMTCPRASWHARRPPHTHRRNGPNRPRPGRVP